MDRDEQIRRLQHQLKDAERGQMIFLLLFVMFGVLSVLNYMAEVNCKKTLISCNTANETLAVEIGDKYGAVCAEMVHEKDAELRDMFFGLEACIGLVEGGDYEWPEWETIEQIPDNEEFSKMVRRYMNADWLATTIFLQYHDKYADKDRMMDWLGKPVGQYAPPYTRRSDP